MIIAKFVAICRKELHSIIVFSAFLPFLLKLFFD